LIHSIKHRRRFPHRLTKSLSTLLLIVLASFLIFWLWIPTTAPFVGLIIGIDCLLLYSYIRFLWSRETAWAWFDSVASLVPAALIAFFFGWQAYWGQIEDQRERLRSDLLEPLSKELSEIACALQDTTKSDWHTEDTVIYIATDYLHSTVLKEAIRSNVFEFNTIRTMLVLESQIDYHNESVKLATDCFLFGRGDNKDWLRNVLGFVEDVETNARSIIEAINYIYDAEQLPIVQDSCNGTPLRLGSDYGK